jgi:hypothetical protein
MAASNGTVGLYGLRKVKLKIKKPGRLEKTQI